MKFIYELYNENGLVLKRAITEVKDVELCFHVSNDEINLVVNEKFRAIFSKEDNLVLKNITLNEILELLEKIEKLKEVKLQVFELKTCIEIYVKHY